MIAHKNLGKFRIEHASSQKRTHHRILEDKSLNLNQDPWNNLNSDLVDHDHLILVYKKSHLKDDHLYPDNYPWTPPDVERLNMVHVMPS